MPPSAEQIRGRLKPAQAKDLLRRGLKVQARARELLGGTGPDHPRRVDTGDLRSSIQVQLRDAGGVAVVRIGSNRKIARWVHDGTGLYGPRREKIVPRTARALVFSSTKYGHKSGRYRGKVVVRSVKGMRRNRFLRDALPAARD